MYRPGEGTRSIQYFGCLCPVESHQLKTKGIADLSDSRLAGTPLRSASSLYQQAFGKSTLSAPGVEKRPPRPGLTPKSSFMSVVSAKSSLDGAETSRSNRSSGPERTRLVRTSSKFLRAQGLSRKFSGTSSLVSGSIDMEEESGALNANRSSGIHSGILMGVLSADSEDGSDVFGGLSTSERGPTRIHTKNAAVDALNCSSASVSVVTDGADPSHSVALKSFLTSKESKFCFELSVASKDRECGGGKDGRKALIAEFQLPTSAIRSSIDFLVNQCSKSDDRVSTSGQQAEEPPGLGLITNRSAAVLPWEIIVPNNLSLVRHIAMTAMCSDIFNKHVEFDRERDTEEMVLFGIYCVFAD